MTTTQAAITNKQVWWLRITLLRFMREATPAQLLAVVKFAAQRMVQDE